MSAEGRVAGDGSPPAPAAGTTVFCHECSRRRPLGGAPQTTPTCPLCGSEFVEVQEGVEAQQQPAASQDGAGAGAQGTWGNLEFRMGGGEDLFGMVEEITHMLNQAIGGAPAGNGFNLGDFAGNASLDRILQQLAERHEPVHTPTPPDILASLPKKTYKQEGDSMPQPNCSICIQDVAVGQVICTLPCQHVFHDDCIMPWLLQNNTCPICRLELKAEGAAGEEAGGRRVQQGRREAGMTLPGQVFQEREQRRSGTAQSRAAGRPQRSGDSDMDSCPELCTDSSSSSGDGSEAGGAGSSGSSIPELLDADGSSSDDEGAGTSRARPPEPAAQPRGSSHTGVGDSPPPLVSDSSYSSYSDAYSDSGTGSEHDWLPGLESDSDSDSEEEEGESEGEDDGDEWNSASSPSLPGLLPDSEEEECSSDEEGVEGVGEEGGLPAGGAPADFPGLVTDDSDSDEEDEEGTNPPAPIAAPVGGGGGLPQKGGNKVAAKGRARSAGEAARGRWDLPRGLGRHLAWLGSGVIVANVGVGLLRHLRARR